MFSLKATPSDNLDSIIENLEQFIISADEDSAEYTTLVDNLEKLYKLKRGHRPSTTELKDWIPVIGSIGGIALIVLFEAFGHTLTSKSLGFTSKLKS